MALTKITPQMFDTSATAHDLNVDNGTFVVDGSASRVGIGTATPSTLLDVNGISTFAGNILPSADSTHDIGTSANRFANAYFDTMYGTVGTVAQPNITSLGTLTALTVDDITINGSTISDAADLTLDVGGDITLDADGGDIVFKDGGTHWASLYTNGTNTYLQNMVNSGDLYLSGKDGSGNGVNALVLDMSAAGDATFNRAVTTGGNLAVTGQGDFSTLVYVGNNNSAFAENNLLFQAPGHAYIDHATTGQNIIFRTSNSSSRDTTAMVIQDDGNVGIGGVASDGNLHIRKTGISTGITNVLMNANFADGSNGSGLSIGYRTDETTAVLAPRTATGNIAFYAYNNSAWFEAMRMSTAGNIGINESNPGYKLEVNGTAHVVNTLTAGAVGIPSQGITLNQGFGTGVPTMTMLGTAANGRAGAIIFQEQGASNTAAIYSTDGGTGNGAYGGLTIATYQSDLRFATNGLASTRMIINSSGYVGIGAMNPTAMLQITDENAGQPMLQVRNYATSATGSFGNAHSVEFRSATSTTTHGMLVTHYESDQSRRALDIANNAGIFASFNTAGHFLMGKTSSNFDNAGIELRATGELIVTRANDLLHLNRISSDGTLVTFRRGSSSTVGSIAVYTTGTYYNTTSDKRLKENIADAPSASDDIDNIQVRSFDWKSNGSHQKYGMVAQELLPVAPEAVHEPENSEEMMNIDYSKLVPMLVKEIQSLRTRVAQLEEEK